jgi:hypothetical protein
MLNVRFRGQSGQQVSGKLHLRLRRSVLLKILPTLRARENVRGKQRGKIRGLMPRGFSAGAS